MNFGAKSKDLLVELKRSDWLPPYNEDGVRGVLAEIQALYDELTDTLGGRTTVSAEMEDGTEDFARPDQLRYGEIGCVSYFCPRRA